MTFSTLYKFLLRKSATAAMFVAIAAQGALYPTLGHAQTAGGVIVGTIRWDAWVGATDTSAQNPPGHTDYSDLGLQVETALGPNQFHDRVPFYGVETSSSSVQVRELTQAQMDADIAYANRAGINYWAFDFQSSGNGFDIAKNLYLSSTQRNGLNFSYILGFVTSTEEDQIVSDFARSYYQLVNGRPLIYLYNYSSSQASFVSDLRSRTIATGLRNPYIVLMDATSASHAASTGAALGVDAISTYADAGPTGSTANGGAYSTVASWNQSNWASYRTAGASSGLKVVPWVTTGWDNRPRNLNPEVFAVPTPPATAWFAEATPTEIKSNLQAALTWINNNPSTADANTVLMYAWNEFDEGGWLTPTLYHGADRLYAVSEATRYASSSNWDPTQTASKAFDGDGGTNWQAAASDAFLGSWLGESLRQGVGQGLSEDQTFSQATISEYGNRTTGFQIQYRNGSNWKVAYTGAAIGATGVPVTFTFPAVTGSAARIFFTSGTDTPIIYEFSLNNTPATTDNLALYKSYSSSSNYDPTQTPDKAFDGDPGTDWQSATAFSSSWLAVDLGARTSFDTIKLSEFGDRTTGFQIQYWNGASWVTAYTGTTIGSSLAVTLPGGPICASQVRLKYLSGTATPIIYEMGVYLTVAHATS